MALAGCSLFGKKVDFSQYDLLPEFSGGSDAEKEAICEAINNLSPVVKKNGDDLYSDGVEILKEDSGDYVKVTKSQVFDKYTVKLEWEADESQSTFVSRTSPDAEHDVFTLKFPGYGGADTSFSWKLKKASCGSCETAGDVVATYNAKLKGYSHPHIETSIAEINAVTDGEQTINGVTYPSTFNMVDYTLAKPYFKKTPDDPNPDYYYVSTKGKIIYYSPDGNWMLLGNGKQVVEVYAGSALDLNPAGYPAIQTGAYVQVDGNLSQYCGNVQIGYVTKIVACEKGDIVDPVDYGTIDESFIANNLKLASPYKCEKQAIDGFSNSICTVTGKVKTAKTAGVKPGERFTFVLKVGEQELTVAYDYHTDKEGTLGLFNNIKPKIAVAGTEMTIRGTMRYSGSDDNSFIQNNIQTAVWNLVPFNAADVK
jgi:hypothetical protein